jgi:hypothetical protein
MNLLRAIFPVFALAVMLAPAFAGETPPPTEQTKAVEALVTKAAALIEKEGQAAAFAEFRKRTASGYTVAHTFMPTKEPASTRTEIKTDFGTYCCLLRKYGDYDLFVEGTDARPRATIFRRP